MPTLFVLFGFRFLFYSNDHSPIHIHVVKGECRASFTVFPVELIENQGFKPKEIKLIAGIVKENQEIIAEYWNRFFNN